MQVALQGEVGSFHHLAAQRLLGEGHSYTSGETFTDVFALLADKRAEKAVVAVENSLYGSINEVYDLLKKHRFAIVGEISERIHQNLISLPGASLLGIKHVMSHPVALAQCSEFLDRHLPQAERVEYYDTAASVSHIQELGDPAVAAIASTFAAEQAGLPILESRIENDKLNYTRFLLIDPDGQPPKGADKASLVLQTSHRPGALYKALGVFAKTGINLTKLQSRPLPGKVWKYQFYVDVEAAGAVLQQAITDLEAQGCAVTLLGQYLADTTEYEV